MKVELVGGPLDGEVVDVPETMRYYRIPLATMPEPWQFSGDGDYVAGMIQALRCGVYSPNGTAPRDFIWRGEEGTHG